jgi:hypothetical protein
LCAGFVYLNLKTSKKILIIEASVIVALLAFLLPKKFKRGHEKMKYPQYFKVREITRRSDCLGKE